MGLRGILIHPDPRLRAIAAPVEAFDAELAGLARDLLETMYAAPGRGLAAPQVGVGWRVFVIDTEWRTGAPAPQVMVNPRILEVSQERVVMEEGCLSIPGQPCRVERPEGLRLAWQEVGGAAREAWFSGIGARAVQHEIDHLDGILCIDRIAHPAGA